MTSSARSSVRSRPRHRTSAGLDDLARRSRARTSAHRHRINIKSQVRAQTSPTSLARYTFTSRSASACTVRFPDRPCRAYSRLHSSRCSTISLAGVLFLRDIVKRADAPPVANFIGAIVQAEQLGVPDREGPPNPVAAAAHPAPPARGGGRREGPGQDALPDGRLHLPTIFIVILGPAIVTVMGGNSGL